MTDVTDRILRPRRPASTGVVWAILLGLALAAPAHGQTLCSEPVEPICATTIPATDPSAATDQGVARTRCVEDAQSYRDKLDEYRRCLEGSVADAEKNVQAIDAFIACLQGEEPECRLERPR